MSESPLFYRTLHDKVEAMPDGPSAYLRAPKWKRIFNVIGLVGVAAGMLASLLILLWATGGSQLS